MLEHRGYPIEQLCEKSTYLEVAYLLMHGELPSGDTFQAFENEVTHHTMMHEAFRTFLYGFRHDAHPMAMLVGMLGIAITFAPDPLYAFYKDQAFDFISNHKRQVPKVEF